MFLAWSSNLIDQAALVGVLKMQGDEWFKLMSERCPHLFADLVIFISPTQLAQMKDVIASVESVTKKQDPNSAHGVFYGYDFHLNEEGVHLIEINTNAGGAFLNALLIKSQKAAGPIGTSIAMENLERVFITMFYNEWILCSGDKPLKTMAIVDEQPKSQFLYPEFLLAQKIFETEGINTYILDPSEMEINESGVFYQQERIDLIYNRLTDFRLEHYPNLLSAFLKKQVVLTPNPIHYETYADKRNLVKLTDANILQSLGASKTTIEILLKGIPETKLIKPEDSDFWWGQRKHWFFKPVSGYGSKGAYRGDKLTKRVFDEIMHSDYVAQRLAMPREVNALKYDVRCYVYQGELQFIMARVYQGQTTNFRTPGGGFAIVRMD